MPRSLLQPGPGTRGAALVTVDGRAYPLVSAAITARAEGGLARTALVQEFRNPCDQPLEVLYTLPLPADGAVIGCTFRIGERVFRGVIEKREQARETYERAILEGRTASLIEEDRADTFSQRLGAIPPGQSVTVEIDVLHRIDFAPAMGGEPPRWEYRFPTVVGVRYEGGPGRVTDAERLDVDRAGEGEIPTRVELDLTVADGSPDALRATSTTHDIVCAGSDGVTKIQLRHGARLDRDLVVRWAATSEQVGVRIVEGPGLPGDEGRYALLTLTPPAVPEHAMRRDVTVLLDASGSMSGKPFDVARTVLSGLLEGLEPGDRFEVIAFSNAPVRLTRGLMDVRPEEVGKMVRALAALEADGGTEMLGALAEALEPLRPDSQRQVVLVTDGYIGFESEVIGRILRELPEGARLHTVSVGAAPNRTLTRGAARAGRGAEVFAFDEPSAHEAADRLCRATVRPVLTEIRLGGPALESHSPARPRDVFAGQPLVLALEVKPQGGTLDVSGLQSGTGERRIWRVAIPAERVAPDARPAHGVAGTPLPIGALYGREAIADLELEVAKRGAEGSDLDFRIEQSGLRHQIASRMTSLVAVADQPSTDPGATRRRERLPVELPAGVSAQAVGLYRGGLIKAQVASAPGAAMFLGAIRGGPARERRLPFEWSKSVRHMLEATEAPGDSIEIEGGRVVRAAEGFLTVEFESPLDGFLLPDGVVDLRPDGGRRRVARMVPGDSGPRGPHPVGSTVRLTLAVSGNSKWLWARTVELRWPWRPAESTDKPVWIVLTLDRTADIAGAR